MTEKFQLHHERMNKFDRLIKVFPDDLVTPVDGTYLRKVVRRARQNKHKRSKTAHKLAAEVPESIPSTANVKSENAPKAPEPKVKKTMELAQPGKGTEFQVIHVGGDET